MSTVSEVGSFAAVAAPLTVTPGLDTALVLRAAALQGARHAYATVFGICAGVLCWGVAAAVGASGLRSASPTAFGLLRSAGAAYVIWLGVGMYLRLRRRDAEDTAAANRSRMPGPDEPLRRAWSRGFVANLLNPRFGLFYLATIPQFVASGAPRLPQGLLLALVHNAMDLAWFTLLVLGVRLFRGVLADPAVRRWADAVAGTVLIVFGVRLLFGV